MKKMLDELKKLDTSYDVPQGFSKKVMDKIKNESTLNVAADTPKNNKGWASRVIKYVIPCTSVAAVILVAFIYRGTMNTKEFALDSIQVATLRGESNSAYMESYSVPEPKNFVMPNSADNNGAISDKSNSLVANSKVYDTFDFSAPNNETDETESVMMPNVSATRYVESDIEKTLKEFDIQYSIIGDEICVQNYTIEEVEECLKEHLDAVEITNDENIIRIKLK